MQEILFALMIITIQPDGTITDTSRQSEIAGIPSLMNSEQCNAMAEMKNQGFAQLQQSLSQALGTPVARLHAHCDPVKVQTYKLVPE